MARHLRRLAENAVDRTDDVVDALHALARPLVEDHHLDPLLARIGDARYVLLGEGSHGTSEFYTWRARLTRRLILEKGFSFVAVEGDWPDCHRIHRYIHARRGSGANARAVLHGFERWPTWMWANREIESLTEWLRAHNQRLPEERRVGFHGLDVYSLWESMAAVVGYLDRVDPEAGKRARLAYECFAPFGRDEQRYARSTMLAPTSCEDAVVRTLSDLRRRAPLYREDGREAYFDAEQNALCAKNAELYYRTMVRGGSASWNVRDMHMVETLERLVDFHGRDSKAIVWEHNTHIGDARFTDMAEVGEVNVGQLVRERHEHEGVVLIGFSTHRGTVIAGEEWGEPMKRMRVPPGRPGSWEDALHRLGHADRLLIFDDEHLNPALLESRGHRAIGVVYHPEIEQYGNYVPTQLPRRYDALLFVDESTALSPLHLPSHEMHEFPETYPTGM
ncbi:MAG: erythromycin esterase family protein [Polyangiales bacterium]